MQIWSKEASKSACPSAERESAQKTGLFSFVEKNRVLHRCIRANEWRCFCNLNQSRASKGWGSIRWACDWKEACSASKKIFAVVSVEPFRQQDVSIINGSATFFIRNWSEFFLNTKATFISTTWMALLHISISILAVSLHTMNQLKAENMPAANHAKQNMSS